MVTAMNSLLSAPSFDWQSENITTELYEFKQHAELNFEGPLEGIKDASKLAFNSRISIETATRRVHRLIHDEATTTRSTLRITRLNGSPATPHGTTRYSIVQDWMLSQDKSMYLESAINHVKVHEAKLADIASFRQSQHRATVNLVSRKHNAPRRNNTPNHTSPHTSTPHTYTLHTPTSKHTRTSTCPNCTTSHEPGRTNCPARTSKCRN